MESPQAMVWHTTCKGDKPGPFPRPSVAFASRPWSNNTLSTGSSSVNAATLNTSPTLVTAPSLRYSATPRASPAATRPTRLCCCGGSGCGLPRVARSSNLCLATSARETPPPPVLTSFHKNFSSPNNDANLSLSGRKKARNTVDVSARIGGRSAFAPFARASTTSSSKDRATPASRSKKA